MHTVLTTLINRLDNAKITDANVIRWGCPVPSFGDLQNSVVATLGINPSNREFMDEVGEELEGDLRRFHTLKSLGLNSWSDADTRHLRLILKSCHTYFTWNPYDRWFKRLDYVISGTKASFYNESLKACHLDLIPYATACKWTELSGKQRSLLLAIAGDVLGLLLQDSPVRLLVLNGKSVVEGFQEIYGDSLEAKKMPSWDLPRKSGENVGGIAYRGVIDSISGIDIGRKILVLGYNHNLQSSFGVTTKVVKEIRNWITQASVEAFK